MHKVHIWWNVHRDIAIQCTRIDSKHAAAAATEAEYLHYKLMCTLRQNVEKCDAECCAESASGFGLCAH